MPYDEKVVEEPVDELDLEGGELADDEEKESIVPADELQKEPPLAMAEKGETFNVFVPIMKVNEERREVWGWGAKEEPDQSNEIMDYDTSKPQFLDWSSRAQKRSGGKSMGNLRSMHQNVRSEEHTSELQSLS